MPKRTLDHIENFEISENEIDDSYEALMAIDRLGEGMFWAYDQVERLEHIAVRRARKGNVKYCLVGEILGDFPHGALSCLFQWYAVSACNYAQLVGWLHTKDPKAAKQYVKRVMPTVLGYRNKVAAHLAITSPRAEDNVADLAASLLTQIAYGEGRLLAGAIRQRVPDGQELIGPTRNLSWSLTGVHTALKKRYWPTGRPVPYQAIRVPPKSTIHLDFRLPQDGDETV